MIVGWGNAHPLCCRKNTDTANPMNYNGGPMQVLNLTPSEKLTLEQELLKMFNGAVLKNTQGDPVGKSNMTTLAITTVSAGRASLTFIYSHDDVNITNPGVWQININRLRMYFDDRVMAIFERHGVINN